MKANIWPEVTFEDIAASSRYPIGDGDHGAIKPAMYRDSGIPYIRVADIGDGELLKKKMVFISPEVHRNNPKSHLFPNDIVISKTGATIGKVALIPLDMKEANTTSSVGKITVDPKKANPRFVLELMRSRRFQRAMWSVSHKSAQPGFNIKDLKKFKIPLPPLKEQERIVGLLGDADELRKLRAQADVRGAALLPALFNEMFGEPVSNPKKLPKELLGNLMRVKSGDSLPAKDMDVNGEFPVYGGNGISGYHGKFMFEKPVIVIGRVGAYCGAVHLSEPKSWVTDNALYVSEFKKEFDTNYLVAALRVANFNQYAGRAAQPLVSGSRIYPVPIIVPPLPLQKEFAQRVTEIRELEAKQAASRQRLESLFQSMLHRAFNGEL